MNELLNGITVLDFSEYIAGPYCGSLLADFGARVIKVEPPDGAEERRMGNLHRYKGNTRMALSFNGGKESVAIDLRTPAGQELVYKMVASADVVIQNFVPGMAEKLGIDYDTLKKRNPRIVFVSSTAFGEVGPYRARKGFDIIAHAASGIMSHYADEDGCPRGPGGIPYIDIGTGMFNALAVVSALYHRDRAGEGQKIETSLFSTGLAWQSMRMIHVDRLDDRRLEAERHILETAHQEGKKHSQIIDEFAEMRLRDDQPDTVRPIEVPECNHRPTDVHVYPYYRVYETANGYIGIAALNRNLRDKLGTALGIVDKDAAVEVGHISDDVYFQQKEVMARIEARLKERSNAYWLEKLQEAGVPCGQVNYVADLYTDPQAVALELIWKLENRDLGPYKTAGNPIRFLNTPLKPGRGAPALGADTSRVLQEFGIGSEKIEQLKKDGVIK